MVGCPGTRESAQAMGTTDPRRSKKSRPKIRASPELETARLQATARMFRPQARASQGAISASPRRDRNRGGEGESIDGESARACGKCLDCWHPPARTVLNWKETRAVPRAEIQAVDERSGLRRDRSPPVPSGQFPAADAIERFRPDRSPYEPLPRDSGCALRLRRRKIDSANAAPRPPR